MRIIICGAGEVGRSIAKQLVFEGNDITIIEQSEELIDRVNKHLDVKAIIGYASHPDTLRKAGAEKTDMIIAVTQSDEINMIACQVAHSVFDIPKKIARIRTQSYLIGGMEKKIFSNNHIPIDVIISPELEVAKHIYEKLHIPGAIEAISFADNKVKVISLKILKNSQVEKLTLEEANKRIEHLNSTFIGVFREDSFFMYKSKNLIVENDEIFLISDIKSLKETMGFLGHEEEESQKIKIIGGGRIGTSLAKKLEKNDSSSSVKIIERNVKRANKIAELLSSTIIINGDALEQEILDEANISSADTLISVSNDDEVNILSALLAKKSGCKRVIAIINSASFAPLFSSLGIDAIVVPREITVSTILKHIKRFELVNIHSICNAMVEITEIVLPEEAYAIGKTILDLRLPEGLDICMIIRDDEIIISTLKDKLISGDRLIILCKAKDNKLIAKFFSDKHKNKYF